MRCCQFQVKELRFCQYTPDASTRPCSSDSTCGSSRSQTSRAVTLDRSCAGVVAPDKTIGLKGWARAAARARASTEQLNAAACRASRLGNSLLRGVKRPFASPSFTITDRPAACASSNASPADCSKRFQVACTLSNRCFPSDVRISKAARRVSACPTPERDRPIFQPRCSFNLSSAASTSVAESTPESSVAEWIWYKLRFGNREAVSSCCVERCAAV
mmetsp:Transcript_564/g.871  ORF Transcript_564/g.871 Transcript_564/m.871 type:complete len:217 (+) Transcript_564:225-875(+)